MTDTNQTSNQSTSWCPNPDDMDRCLHCRLPWDQHTASNPSWCPRVIEAPSKLVACPFCGGTDIFIETDEYGSGGQHVPPYHVGCKKCGAEQCRDQQVDAIAAWNKRFPVETTKDPAPSAMQALTAALQADVEYAWAFHCNVAMPIMDRVNCSQEAANRAGAAVMQHLFQIDITKHPHWMWNSAQETSEQCDSCDPDHGTWRCEKPSGHDGCHEVHGKTAYVSWQPHIDWKSLHPDKPAMALGEQPEKASERKNPADFSGGPLEYPEDFDPQ